MARIRKSKISIEYSSEKQHIVWRIAIYIRLSREDGNDESLSVGNQRKIIQEYLEKTFSGEYVIVDFYIDDGRTGTSADETRPEYQRLIRDIQDGKVTCMICKNLSRAFRNYADQGKFLEEFLPSYKARFIAISNPFVDTYADPDCMQNMEIPINGLMNDRYAAKTSADIRRTFDTKRRNGEFIGAFAPYGYLKKTNDKNALIVDEEAAAVVQDIFRWFVEGMSKGGIAKRLNELGIPNPTAYKRAKGFHYENPHAKENDGLWNPTCVSRLLQNPMYIGTMVQGKQQVIS